MGKLTEAVAKNDTHALKLVLQKEQNEFKQALMLACEENKSEVIELLFSYRRIDSISFNAALFDAIIACNAKAVETLLNCKDKALELNHSNILLAVTSQQALMVEMLLKDGRIDPAENNNQALQLAFTINNEKIVEILLSDKRVKQNVNYKILYKAVENDFFNAVKLLLENSSIDFSEDKDLYTLIELAVATNSLKMVTILLKFGINPFPSINKNPIDQLRRSARDIILLGNCLGLKGKFNCAANDLIIKGKHGGNILFLSIDALNMHLIHFNDIIQNNMFSLHIEQQFTADEKQAFKIVVETFSAFNKAISYKSLIDLVQQNLHEHESNNENLYKNYLHQATRYHQDKPVIIPCYWMGHVGVGVIYKDKFDVINRGPGGFEQGIERYQFERKNLWGYAPPNVEMLALEIQKMSTNYRKELADYNTKINTNIDLPSLQKLRLKTLISVIFKRQGVGNCSYTNPKHTIYDILLLLKENDAQFKDIDVGKIYKAFSSFDRFFAIDIYYKSNKDSININKWDPFIKYLQQKVKDSARSQAIAKYLVNLVPEIKVHYKQEAMIEAPPEPTTLGKRKRRNKP